MPEARGGLLDGPYSHARRALRGVELGRGCAGMAALLETNVEPALAIERWGSAAAKDALFASLTDGGGLATTGRDARGISFVTTTLRDVRSAVGEVVAGGRDGAAAGELRAMLEQRRAAGGFAEVVLLPTGYADAWNAFASAEALEESDPWRRERLTPEFKQRLLERIPLGRFATLDDVMEFLVAGASAVQIGTANFYDPLATQRIARDIEAWCDARGITSLDTIRGQVKIEG